MNLFFLKRNKGFSIAEIVVYVAIVTVVLFSIINIVVIFSRSNNQATIYSNIKNSAIFGLEKIIKETRLSTSIDFNESVFNSLDGILVLNSKDENGLIEAIKFYLDEGLIKMDLNGNYLDTITYSDTKISSLIFVPISTGNSQAVKIEINFGSESTGLSKDETFYSTAVLRNSY